MILFFISFMLIVRFYESLRLLLLVISTPFVLLRFAFPILKRIESLRTQFALSLHINIVPETITILISIYFLLIKFSRCIVYRILIGLILMFWPLVTVTALIALLNMRLIIEIYDRHFLFNLLYPKQSNWQ